MSEQRDIKFRAFHNGKITNDVPVYKNMWYAMTTQSGPTQMTFIEDAIIMQYTGLKDKNGTEIYEGDILKVEKTFYVFLFTVSFDDGEFIASRTKSKRGERVCGLRQMPICEKKIEIAGNIHETPELLTGEKLETK